MAKIVNAWNEWDPLKLVIMGRPEGTNIPAPEPCWWYDLPEGGYPLGSWGPFPQEMVDAANAQMNEFQKRIEKRGAKVERVTIEPFMTSKNPVSTPDWTQLNNHGVNNVRDVTLVHGNMVIESTTCRRSRWYEYLNLRPFWEKYFKEDPEMVWMSAPKPRLTDKSYVKNYYYYYENVWSHEEKLAKARKSEFQLTEHEPLWDAADAMRFGKDVFHQISAVTNKAGFDWLKRQYAALGLRMHPVTFDNYLHPWHIDVNLAPLHPGKCMYNPDWPPITEQFWELFKKNDWELIPAVKPEAIHKHHCYLICEYGQTSWISMNTFSFDPKTIFVEAHEKAYCEQLDKLGMEVEAINYDKVIPFGGALHCTTLDINRVGGCEDYFPNQVPGY